MCLLFHLKLNLKTPVGCLSFSKNPLDPSELSTYKCNHNLANTDWFSTKGLYIFNLNIHHLYPKLDDIRIHVLF